MRCQGYTRRGGFMSLGPVYWSQCKNDAEFILTVTQDGVDQSFPACSSCRDACTQYGIDILTTKNIEAEK